MASLKYWDDVLGDFVTLLAPTSASVILNGTQRPTAVIGSNGDYYLDTDDHILYGPKTGSVWPTAVGAASGSQTYVGPEPPEASGIGDIWYDTDDLNRMYIAKSEGADQIGFGEWEPVSSAPPPITETTQIFHQTTPPDAFSVPAPTQADFWFQLPDNSQYYYDVAAPGNHWVLVKDTDIQDAQDTANSKTKHFAQPTVPVSITVGDTWVDTAPNHGNKFYTAMSVGADAIQTGEWELSQDAQGALDVAKSKPDIFYQSSPPWSDDDTTHTVDEGDVWYDTDDKNKPYVWDATAKKWRSLRDGSIADVQILAASKTTNFTQAAVPVSTAIGDTWVDTDDHNKLYTAKSVGADQVTAGEWELAQDTYTAQSTADGKIATYHLADPPWPDLSVGHDLDAGDIWYEIDNANKPWFWEAVAKRWVSVQDGTIQDAHQLAESKTTNFVQDTIPVSTAVGDTWVYPSGNNKLYVARIIGANEIKTGEWELSQDWYTANATANTKTRTFLQTQPPPVSTAAGDLWYDVGNGNKQYRASAPGVTTIATFPNAGWQLVQDTTIAAAAQAASDANTAAQAALTKAEAAQSTADGAINTYYQENAPWADGSAQPAGVVGDMWFKSSTGVAYRWTGTTWEVIPDTAITQALAAANKAQLTADGKITAHYLTAAPWPNGNATHDPAFGDLWYDITVGSGGVPLNEPYYWHQSRNWVSVRDGTIKDVRDLAASKTTNFSQASIPTALTIGDTWVDTTAGHGNRLYIARSVGANEILTGEWELAQDWAAADAVAKAKTKTFVQNASPAPTSITVGDIWYNTADNNKPYYASAIGVNAIQGPPANGWWSVQDKEIQAASAAIGGINSQLSGINSQLTEQGTALDGMVKYWYQETQPWLSSSDPKVVGDMWFQTSTAKAYQWNGSAWVEQPTAVSQAMSVASTAKTTADGNIAAYYLNVPLWNNGDATHDLNFGDLWYDTTPVTGKNTPRYWANNRTWTLVQDGTIKDAQDTANAKSATFVVGVPIGQTTGAPIPTAITAGDTWINTTDANKMYVAKGLPATAITVPPAATGWQLMQDSGSKNATFTNSVAPGVTTGASIPVAITAGDTWVNVGDNSKLYVAKNVGANAITLAPAPTGWQLAQDYASKNVTFSVSVPAGQTSGAPIPTALAAGDTWINTGDRSKLYLARNAGANSITTSGITGWQLSQDSSSATTNFVQPGIPTSNNKGDTWIDTDDNSKLYVAMSAGATTIATGQWELSQDYAAAKAAADSKINAYYSTTPPWANGTAGHTSDHGDIWYNTTLVGVPAVPKNEPAYWDDVTPTFKRQWISIQDGRIIEAQETADQKTQVFYQDGPIPGHVYNPPTDPEPVPPLGITEGDLWYQTNLNNKVWYWDGSHWVDAQDESIQTISTLASQMQANYEMHERALEGLGEDIQDVADTVLSINDVANSAYNRVTTSDYPPSAADTAGRGNGSLWFVRTRARTNQATNPSAEISTAGIAGGNAALARVAIVPYPDVGGGWGVQATNSSANGHYVEWHTGANRIPCSEGQTFTVSFYSTLVNGIGAGVHARLIWYNAAGDYAGEVSGAGIQLVPNQWDRPWITVQAPAGAASFTARAYSPATNTNDVWLVDGLLIEQDEVVGRYFDGDSYDASWESTRYTSASSLVGNKITQVWELDDGGWVQKFLAESMMVPVSTDSLIGTFDGAYLKYGSVAMNKLNVTMATTSEALVAGDIVNMTNVGNTYRVRKACAAAGATQYEAHGFVLDNAASGVMVPVYHFGNNTALTDLSVGVQWLSTTPGAVATTPPSAAGTLVQRVGFSSTSAALNFSPGDPIKIV
jgi:hypothetical protein